MASIHTRLIVALCAAAATGSPGAASAPAPAPTTFYVAVNGHDGWSGTLAAPNAAKTDGPFASVSHARDAIRALKVAGPLAKPVRVLVRGGTHALREPFILGPEDSGTAAAPITYAAYPGEKPVLSGGHALSGWKRYRGDVWTCAIGDLGPEGLRFRQLFCRGERQVPARWPNRDPKRPRTGGFLTCESSPQMATGKEIRYPAGAFPRRWARPSEVEVLIYPSPNWTNRRVPIESVDGKQRLLRLSRSAGTLQPGNRFYVYNAIEELDAPGEWYLDRRDSMLYFRPPAGMKSPDSVTVPVLENLIVLRGDFGKSEFVEHVSLSHLVLECCHGNAVVLRGARHCGLIGCGVRQAGGAGVVLDAGSSFCRVAGNDIAYPGGHAIAMYYNVGSPDACTDNTITNNYAHHCGEITMCSFGWGSGIAISGRRNTLSHNLVHDTAYSAINFDGYDHVIEYNHVHHTSLEGSDCGSLYGWVNSKAGSGNITIRYNRIHDSVGFGMVERGRYQTPYYSWGIYLDDYLSHCTVTGNLVYRAWRAPLHLHGGWNNRVENNVFVDGALSQVDLSNMPRNKPSLSGITGKDAPGTGEWSMSGIILRRNILCAGIPGSATYGGYAFEERVVAEADRNLYWREGEPPLMRLADWPAGDSWRLWRAGGRDAHSVVAAPNFVRPDRDDYRLRPDSPALGLGFEPLPIERMGLVESSERASWPVVEPETVRDPAIPPPPPPPAAGIPIGRAYAAAGPIRIDGKMDPGEWGDVIPSRGLPLEPIAGRDAAIEPGAAAHARFDADALYVAVAVEAGAPSPDAVEILTQALVEMGDGQRVVLRGSASGSWERAGDGGPARPGAKPDRGAVSYAVAKGTETWCAEWRIPHSVSGIVPGRVTRLRFNVRLRRNGQWIEWVRGVKPRDAGAGYLLLDPAVSADAANLLPNGDFEEGADKPTGWVTAERVTGEVLAGAARPRCLWAAEGRGGSRCLKLEAPDGGAARAVECWWNQTLHLAPGSYVLTYDVRAVDIRTEGDGGCFYASGWAWVKQGQGRMGMNLGYSRESQIEAGSAPLWTRRETVFDVPADTESVIVLFGMARATGTVWIDNVRLERCR